ncbi:Asp-tRNA(Asn)/Glu-tRNA(Gln) amidotransferase subunit GatB [Patescibacteria group bacterium]|nr:Asp-tRNA(Asn)/Glu-tRNA(Gln) amidotransferase subunit GatB [Patescibacteria group bacterium]
MKYKPVIGLEVHVELKTKSKMFCACSADYFGKKPNTHTCPVCLGLPGALPVTNKKAIEWCLKIGLALNCNIRLFSKFDRKNYFYPDLPKGYQISQYDQPFCEKGSISVKSGDSTKKIGITRVHQEEDTGKLIHDFVNGKNVSLIDFNRSGVPLVEIVTEPDFESAEEVVDYLKKLQQIVRYLGVSNADMEKGDMRLEPNISLKLTDQQGLPNFKVEVKNINSFKFVEKAINYELKRQEELLEKKETPKQETRGWNEKKQTTQSQRNKEEANDYRYFPEPDLPPFRFEQKYIDNLKNELPELPWQKLERFQIEFKLSLYDAEIITRERSTAEYFERTVVLGKEKNISPKQIANEIINKKINIEKLLPNELISQISLKSQFAQVNEEEIQEAIKKVLSQQEKAKNDYENGKIEVLGFLIGMVRKEIGKPIDPGKIKEILEKELNR